MKGYVYLITRSDNQKYVGITYDIPKRMYAHKKSKRFEIGIKNIEVLEECLTYEEAEKLEPMYIEKYDTFYNGLNGSVDGKGNHLAPNFTTKGYKFSDESRQKMKENHWSTKMKNTWTTNTVYSEETRKKWSETRKGICWRPRKITRDEALKLIKLYEEDSINYSDDFVKQFVKVKDKKRVGKVPLEELKAPNGKYLNKIKLFSEYFCKEYNVTPQAITGLLKNGISDADTITK